MVEGLWMKNLNGERRLEYTVLVWVVPASITPLVPLFSSSKYTTLKLTIHYTRAPTKQSSVFETIEAVPWATAIAHRGPTLVPGRPNFQNVFNNVIDGAISLGSGGTGMSVSGMGIGI